MDLHGTHDRSSPPQTPDASAVVALFDRACRGDRAAFGQVVRLYQHRLFNTVLRLVGDHDDATELTQETFAQALAKLATFRGESGPYTWLCRIATNLALDRLRRQKRRSTVSLTPARNGDVRDQAAGLLERVRQSGPGPAEALDRRERDEQVLAALARVDTEYRTVLVLRDVDGLDYQDIADVLGLPLGTLKSRLFRARVALREQLKGYMS